jgi:hypothetical protein
LPTFGRPTMATTGSDTEGAGLVDMAPSVGEAPLPRRHPG